MPSPEPHVAPGAAQAPRAAADQPDEHGAEASVRKRQSAPRTLFEAKPPSPFISVVNNGWMMMAAVLVVAYLFATLFPTLGGLLLIGAPLAVLGAVSLAAFQVRKVRLTVTDELVRVSNAKTGRAADRSEVRSAVLVESLARKRFGPRTTDLILLDRDGRCALLLNGNLWPVAILERVIELLPTVPLERIGGRQTPLTLAARYPKILQNTDNSHRFQPKPRMY